MKTAAQYEGGSFNIQCRASDVHVHVRHSGTHRAIDIMTEHAMSHLSENKSVYIVSNFLPGRAGFTQKDKAALVDKMKRLVSCALDVSLTSNGS